MGNNKNNIRMKTFVTLALIATVSAVQVVPRRLNTELVQFVEQDDAKFNDDLSTELKIEKLGDHGFLIDGPKGNVGVPLNKGTKNEEVKGYVHSSSNDDKLSGFAAKFEASAIDAGNDKGLAFPLTKDAAAANKAKFTAPLEDKE